MRPRFGLSIIASTLLLAGCIEGGSDLERAAVGGVVGCAAGEILADGQCVAGGAIGAAAGALTN
jgi:hypothetical protein